MVMGVGIDEFWHLTPRRLKTIAKAYSLKQKVLDRDMWLLGRYVNIAVADAIGTSFSKNSKSHYLEKPLLDLAEERQLAEKQDRVEYKGMTDEEKQKAELDKAVDYFNSLIMLNKKS